MGGLAVGDQEAQDFASRLLDVLGEAAKGTEWAPPEGGVLVDALVVFIHVDSDGEFGSSWVSHGSDEQAEGMARKVIRDTESSALASTIVTALEVWKNNSE